MALASGLDSQPHLDDGSNGHMIALFNKNKKRKGGTLGFSPLIAQRTNDGEIGEASSHWLRAHHWSSSWDLTRRATDFSILLRPIKMGKGMRSWVSSFGFWPEIQIQLVQKKDICNLSLKNFNLITIFKKKLLLAPVIKFIT